MPKEERTLVEAAKLIHEYCIKHRKNDCHGCPMKRERDWNCVLGGYWPENWCFEGEK